MDNTKLIIGVIVCVVIVIFLYTGLPYKKKENFLRLRSEPNLNCDLGSADCRLSTGQKGECHYANMNRDNYVNRECVEIPWNSPKKEYNSPLTTNNNGMGINEDLQVYSLSAPIGELSAECQWRGICNRSDNKMGVCMSGLCYPETNIVE
jgi:hypothetical protein